jgi:hypothetical protein
VGLALALFTCTRTPALEERLAPGLPVRLSAPLGGAGVVAGPRLLPLDRLGGEVRGLRPEAQQRIGGGRLRAGLRRGPPLCASESPRGEAARGWVGFGAPAGALGRGCAPLEASGGEGGGGLVERKAKGEARVFFGGRSLACEDVHLLLDAGPLCEQGLDVGRELEAGRQLHAWRGDQTFEGIGVEDLGGRSLRRGRSRGGGGRTIHLGEKLLPREPVISLRIRVGRRRAHSAHHDLELAAQGGTGGTVAAATAAAATARTTGRRRRSAA